jgi:hypothetical protein
MSPIDNFSKELIHSFNYIAAGLHKTSRRDVINACLVFYPQIAPMGQWIIHSKIILS